MQYAAIARGERDRDDVCGASIWQTPDGLVVVLEDDEGCAMCEFDATNIPGDLRDEARAMLGQTVTRTDELNAHGDYRTRFTITSHPDLRGFFPYATDDAEFDRDTFWVEDVTR